MRGSEPKLTRKQERGLAALLACGTVSEAAKVAELGEATLWRWLQEPSFKERYRAARQAILQSSIAALQNATLAAVATLQRNLECGTPSVEVQAARALLDQAFRATELGDMLERIEELEQRLLRPTMEVQ